MGDLDIGKIGGLLAGVFLGLSSQAMGQVPHFVESQGVPIRVTTQGLDERPAGQAVVVFEGGAGSRLESWAAILPAVAEFAAVVAYDRSGVGESEWDEVPPTPEKVTARLREILGYLDVAPPYVLVSHSWGGALSHHFASTYPDAVVGLVFIDPTDFTWGPRDEIAVLELVGSDSVYYEARRRRRDGRIVDFIPRVRSERGVIYAMQDQWDSQVFSPPSGVPISVAISAQRPAPATTTVPFDAKIYLDAKFAQRVDRLSSWVQGGGTFTVARTTEHYVHHAEPELIVELIRRIVQHQN